MKNIHKTDLDSSSFEYNLIEEENQDFEENKNFGNFSIVLIEKEEEKSITIPFSFKINENNDKLLPTFQYETNDYILGIRHLLIIKCEEYNSKIIQDYSSENKKIIILLNKKRLMKNIILYLII